MVTSTPSSVLALRTMGKSPCSSFALCRPTGAVVLDDPHRNCLCGVGHMQLAQLVGEMTLLDRHEPMMCRLPVNLIAGSNGQNFGEPPLKGIMIVWDKNRGVPCLNGKVALDEGQKQVQAGHASIAMLAAPGLHKGLATLLSVPPELVEKTANVLLINGKPIILGLNCLNRIPLYGLEVENFQENEGRLTSDIKIFDDFDGPPHAMLDPILAQH